MSYKQLVFRVLICATALCTSITGNAMSYYKQNGVLKIWGDADDSDRAKLKEQLTPDVRTVIVRAPTKGSWTLGRDLAELIEDAKVTTVTEGWCEVFVCPMLFLAGKERMFSAVTRPEASFIKLGISTSHLPPGGDDGSRPWLDITTWWREHTKLGRTEVWPRHAPFIRPAGTLPAEHLMFFHPSAKTSKGSAAECFGAQQSLPYCVPMADNQDALRAGIITTLERYVPADKADIRQDIATPASTAFARLDELPLKIEKLNESCNKHYERFLAYDSPRAFTVSSAGGCSSASAQNATPYKTALDECKKANGTTPGRTCRFYAVDDKVVFTEFSAAIPDGLIGASAGIALGPNNAKIVIGRSLTAEREVKDIASTFESDGTIALLTTFNWEPSSQAGGQQIVEARWVIGDKQVHRSRSTSEFGPAPHKVWFRPKLTEIGTGTVRVDLYANNNFLGSQTLTITEKTTAGK